MEKEKRAIRKSESKPGSPDLNLPWWAELVVAQKSGVNIPATHICHLHHCADCACPIVCLDIDCRKFQMCCPDCFNKSMAGRIVPASQRTFNCGFTSSEFSLKKRSFQGGN